MPTTITTRALSSEKSIPSETLPLQTARKAAPSFFEFSVDKQSRPSFCKFLFLPTAGMLP
uniref:Uncharacterized protein n=1 Tax=Rhizophora mucronata TaxID=61149 RepID=A0A2P2NT32_RHIMU